MKTGLENNSRSFSPSSNLYVRCTRLPLRLKISNSFNLRKLTHNSCSINIFEWINQYECPFWLSSTSQEWFPAKLSITESKKQSNFSNHGSERSSEHDLEGEKRKGKKGRSGEGNKGRKETNERRKKEGRKGRRRERKWGCREAGRTEENIRGKRGSGVARLEGERHLVTQLMA